MVRRLALVAAVAMTLVIAACPRSIASTSPLPTSPKAVAALLQKAQRLSLTTMTVTYQADGWPTARSRRSTVFVVQRENDVAGQPSQFPDLAYRQPAEAGSATSEYFAPPARYDHWTQCQRQDGRSRWTCHYVPPEGNGPQLMFNDDDWPSLLVQVLGLPFIGRAADDGYKVVEGQRLPCLLFGHTTTACFFPDGLIGYYSGSRPAWPVTVRLTSYSPHVSANAFLPPVKPLPWNYQAASTVSRPRITPTAVAAVDGYFWLAGTYPCVTGECSALLRGTEGAKSWIRVGSPPAGTYGIEFANRLDGYALSPYSLYWTGDGGSSWQRVLDHSGSRAPSSLPALSAGRAYSLVTRGCRPAGWGCKELDLATSSVSGDSWTIGVLPVVGEAVNTPTVVTAFGHTAWVMTLANDGRPHLFESVDAGRNFVPLSSAPMSCLSFKAQAASAVTLWGFCATGSLEYPVISTDGGRHFSRLAGWTDEASNAGLFYPLSPGEAVFSPGGPDLWLTRDGGRRFHPSLTLPYTSSSQLAVASRLRWLDLTQGTARSLWLTGNGGVTWQTLAPPRV